MEKIIRGTEIKEILKNKLKQEISKLSDELKLVVLQVGNESASNVYIKSAKNLCEEMNIIFKHKKFDYITEKSLIDEIDKLNNDDSVTGIFLQFPLPKEIDEKKVTEAINPKKDVDGLTSQNLGKLFSFEESLVPSTALGVLEILKYKNIDLKGKNVTIIGRSKVVGLPLLALFLKENATVTICHSKTTNLKEKTKQADILIVAMGKKEFITEDYIKEDVVIIDVGINSYENKLYGDCDFSSVYEKCKYITPVPGGVGQLTVTMLVNNILKAHYLQKNELNKGTKSKIYTRK